MAENYNKEVGKLIKVNWSSSHNQETIQNNKANGITGLEEKIKGICLGAVAIQHSK